MKKRDKFTTIVQITFWVAIAIVGTILFLNCILGGPLIPLKKSFDNQIDLLQQLILHWGFLDIIFPIVSIWKLYKLTEKNQENKNNQENQNNQEK